MGNVNLNDVDFEINKEIVFSTGHITKDDNEILTILSKQDEGMVESFYGGFRLIVSKDTVSDGFDFKRLGSSVLFLVGIALVKGCKWLVLDRDGPVVDALPVHDW